MIFLSEQFVDADLTLRRGGHINRDNFTLYQWMQANYDALKQFYTNFSCQLRQHPDGFFFLIASGQKLKSRVLPKSCVHLGMFLALKARDPEITRTSGRILIDQLLQDIETTVPSDTLQQVYAPRAKESQINRRIHDEITAALKTLTELKFIEIDNNSIKPLESISRFAEYARYDNKPDEIAQIRLENEGGIVFGVDDTEISESVEEKEDEG